MATDDEAEARGRLIRAYLNAYNARDVQGMLACLHPAVRFTNVSGGEVTAATDGIDAFRALAERTAQMFASRCQTPRSLTHDDQRSTLVVAFEGVLAEDLPGGPSAGTRIALEGQTVFTFRDGRLAGIEDRS